MSNKIFAYSSAKIHFGLPKANLFKADLKFFTLKRKLRSYQASPQCIKEHVMHSRNFIFLFIFTVAAFTQTACSRQKADVFSIKQCNGRLHVVFELRAGAAVSGEATCYLCFEDGRVGGSYAILETKGNFLAQGTFFESIFSPPVPDPYEEDVLHILAFLRHAETPGVAVRSEEE